MKILFVGDVIGQPGRRALARWLPELRKQYGIDVALANAENAAGGLGATPQVLDELLSMGFSGLTLGNHTWRKKELAPALDRYDRVVRPANYPDGVPGRGSIQVMLVDGRSIGLVSVLGRVFMESFACPFQRAAEEAAKLRKSTPVVIVDIHAEATSEKVALGWHLDGKCSAVLGTHTHVQTSDERILPGGTAYMTDVGMVGPWDSVIGIERERAVRKFLTGMPHEFKVAKGPVCLGGVVIEVDDVTGRAVSIERITRISSETPLGEEF